MQWYIRVVKSLLYVQLLLWLQGVLLGRWLAGSAAHRKREDSPCSTVP